MAYISRTIHKDCACEFFYILQKLTKSMPLKDMFWGAYFGSFTD